MILGITGGTGCGKTTLLRILETCGGVILDCDAIYHRLLQTDRDLLKAIERRFPGTVRDGSLQRKVLGEVVFSDAQALQDLNTITHSAVKAEVIRLLAGKPDLAAIDAIALFESGLDTLCDVTVAVTAPREDRILRLMARDGISRAYAEKRIDAQHEDAWFRDRCHYSLDNCRSPEDFHCRCLAFLRELGIMKEKQKETTYDY